MQIKANGVTLEVEITEPPGGGRDAPALVLIRGLGTQLVHWPRALIEGFAEAGLRVTVFDNRDCGLSQSFAAPGLCDSPEAISARVLAGDTPAPPYRLDDMARDVVGLLDALAIARAHVLGISMGGAIAQILALDHGARLLSATIVMTACRPLIGPENARDVLPRLLAHPETRDEAQANWVGAHASFGSPGYPMPEDEIRAEAALAWDRGHDHRAINRQLLAILAAPDRRADLARLDLPCLVIHGLDDTLIPEPFGAEIAATIAGAQYAAIPGMGHIITPALSPLIVKRVRAFLAERT